MSRILACLLLVACASTEPAMEPRPDGELSVSSAADSTWVYRLDGGKQCEEGTAVSLDAMKAELTARQVAVLAQEKRMMPLSVTTVCGATTGVANAYLIAPADLSRATAQHAAGPPFEVWDFADEP